MTLQIISAEEIILFHDRLLRVTPGVAGMPDPGRAEAIMYRVLNKIEYEGVTDVWRLAAMHLLAISRGHIFNDGNKRSAISLSIYFLNINGYDYCTSNFIEVMENYVVWVADNKIGKELLLEIITSLINDVSLSNSIKLKVINALNDDQEK